MTDDLFEGFGEALAPLRAAELMPAPRAELMPDGFALPAWIRFVPDVRIKEDVEAAAARALAINLREDDGLQRADAALVELRAAIALAQEVFADHCAEADKAHKRLTGLRAEWLGRGPEAVKDIANGILFEQRRRKQLADEEARARQAVEDAKAKASAARLADEAALAGAPKEVVETLSAQAKVAAAPPVAAAPLAPLKGQTIAKKWKARLVGTAPDAEPHPEMADLTDAQRLSVLKLLKGILDGKAPIAVVAGFDWSYLDARAASETTTLSLPGLEAFEHEAPRAKPGTRRR